MRLADTVEESDVDEAVRLMRVAMQQSSIDPRTGQIDMDVIQTGVSAAERTARAALASRVRDVLESKGADGTGTLGGIRIADIIDELVGGSGMGGITERDVQAALTELQGEVRITQGRVSLISRS